MRWAPHGYGKRREPDDIKRAGWQTRRQAIDANDDRLTWPERELVRQLGEKLYGGTPKRQDPP